MIPAGILGSAHVGASGLSGSYIGGNTSGGSVSGAVVTYTGVNIGAAASDRTVVVGVTGTGGGLTSPSVTIAGVSATLVIGVINSDSTSIYKAAVPTGTTATIVVTYSGSPGVPTCVHVWRITGTIGHTNTSANSSSGSNISRTVTGLAGGFIVAIAYMQTGSVNTTWTNATERYDLSVGIVDRSGADATTVGSTTITTGNGATKTREMAVAAFGP